MRKYYNDVTFVRVLFGVVEQKATTLISLLFLNVTWEYTQVYDSSFEF